MNVVEPPPSQPGDDLDGLLRAFLRSQLPHPWPPPRCQNRRDAGPAVHRLATGRNLMRSRWTLAASVALLFFGAWLLPSRMPNDAKREHGPNGIIISDNPQDVPKANKRQKQLKDKSKPGLAADEGERLPGPDESDMPLLR